MPTLLQIVVEGNTGSTGTIAESIGIIAKKLGWESYIAYGRFPRPSESKLIRIGSDLDIILHGIKTRLFDGHGLGSRESTKDFIKKIEYIKPDIIHLHHLHGYYINIEVLFDYLKFSGIPVVWTFHDCWSFTGHCSHFDHIGCEKWKTECNNCPQLSQYPASWFLDRSNQNFHLKKRLFTSISQLNIIPVSEWMNKLLSRSFFSNTKIKTIHNGVDLQIFKPGVIENNRIQGYCVQNKFVILGVASTWSERKGFFDFIELSKHLSDDYAIILVGLNKLQIKNLPKNIIGISKTGNRQELAELYSMADVFINPTWEDSFPTTNIEALACGTPVITYQTGGSPEALTPETGFIVENGSIKGLIDAIRIVKFNGKSFYTQFCRTRAEEHFSKEKQFLKYFDLYYENLKLKT